jgi:hypothetical protein
MPNKAFVLDLREIHDGADCGAGSRDEGAGADNGQNT